MGITQTLILHFLSLGCIYTLAGIAFVFLLNSTRSINFAYGEMLVAAGLIAASLGSIENFPWPLLVIIISVFVILALLGLAVVFYFPLRNRPPEAIFLSSIGIGMLIQNLLVTGLGAAPRRLYIDSFVQSWSIGGFIIPLHFIILFITTFVIIGALYYFLSYSRLGLSVQAVTQNQDLAMIFGIRPLHTAIASFMIAGLLTAIAGIFLSQNSFLAPEQGSDLLLKAYMLTIIGGWGRVYGLWLGAFLLAFLETILAFWLSYPLTPIVIYASLIILLVYRPGGVLQEKQGQRM